jgi:hypothetical protein
MRGSWSILCNFKVRTVVGLKVFIKWECASSGELRYLGFSSSLAFNCLEVSEELLSSENHFISRRNHMQAPQNYSHLLRSLCGYGHTPIYTLEEGYRSTPTKSSHSWTCLKTWIAL